MKPLEEATVAKGFSWKPTPVVLGLANSPEAEQSEQFRVEPMPTIPIEGGLIGQFLWQWLRIEILAVPERYRGQGVGSQLMASAESIAWAHGCRRAWVDTFSFQAPRFYEKQGYRLFGELADYPPGETRSFYWKELTAPESKQ